MPYTKPEVQQQQQDYDTDMYIDDQTCVFNVATKLEIKVTGVYHTNHTPRNRHWHTMKGENPMDHELDTVENHGTSEGGRCV